MESCDHICKGDGQCNNDLLEMKLKDKEELLNAAGEMGLKMHTQVQETQRYMEEERKLHEKELEEKIQEIYEVKIKLETAERSLEDTKLLSMQAIEDSNLSSQKKVDDLNQKVSLLSKENTSKSSQINHLQLVERQLNEDLDDLQEKYSNLMAEKQEKRKEVDVSYSQEIFTLNEKLIALEEALEVTANAEKKKRNEVEALTLSLKTTKQQLEDNMNEMEAIEQKNTSMFNHLEKAREETKEVTTQLEALKVQYQQTGHSKQGNSLFGEVEDKRLSMEKELKTMEVKYDSITKAYNFLKTQHHNLKSQVTALLSMHSGKADLDHIKNLERTVSQLKSENTQIALRLKEAQNLSDTTGVEALKEMGKSLQPLEGNKEMVEFLLIKLEDSENENKKLKVDLDRTHMVKMCESDKLLQAEQDLHELGLMSEKYKNANMSLRLKLEEAENKYKAENQKRILVEKKFNYDSSNDVEPIGISIKKERSPPPFMKKASKQKFDQPTSTQSKEKSNTNSLGVLQPVDWSETLKTLREKQKLLKEGKETVAVVQNAETPQLPKDRKVTFKSPSDEDENKQVVKEPNIVSESKENKPRTASSSCLKNSKRKSSFNLVPKPVLQPEKERKNIGPGTNKTGNEEESCGVQ